jgi:hypothetical protein
MLDMWLNGCNMNSLKMFGYFFTSVTRGNCSSVEIVPQQKNQSYLQRNVIHSKTASHQILNTIRLKLDNVEYEISMIYFK